jgi:hypothetical protein
MSRRSILVALAAVAAMAGLGAFALAPVCEALDREQVSSIKPPISERNDRDFYLRVFQKRDGQWLECKTRLSRLLRY